MKCPDCQNELQVVSLKGMNIHECLKCKGKWFERKELMTVKNKADRGSKWLNFDPFGKDAQNLSVASPGKSCPQCANAMQSLTYSQSQVVIGKCPACEGVWLSHGELAKILLYLEKNAKVGTSGEIKDFWAVLGILETKIAVEHPRLAQLWASIENISPIK